MLSGREERREGSRWRGRDNAWGEGVRGWREGKEAVNSAARLDTQWYICRSQTSYLVYDIADLNLSTIYRLFAPPKYPSHKTGSNYEGQIWNKDIAW